MPHGDRAVENFSPGGQSDIFAPNSTAMQHEDDLRGLAKVMQFMRAVSILLLVIHVYWFCYRWLEGLG